MVRQAAKHEMMRSANTAMLLECLFEGGPKTRRQLQEYTNLSWGAVSNIIADLLEQGILCEQQLQGSYAGRRPAVISVNPEKNLTIGIDIHMHGLTTVVVDLSGGIRTKRYKSIISPSRIEILDEVIRLVRDMLKELGISRQEVIGIGVSTQGVIDKTERICLYSPHLPDWEDVPVCDILEKEFSVPAFLLRDTNAMLMVEQKRHYKQVGSMLFIKHDMGLGMSMITDGKLYTGYDGNAGELGHMIINPDGPLCTCGNHGCLEAYVSGRSLLNQVREGAGAGKCEAIPRDLSFPEAIGAAADLAYRGNTYVKELFAVMGQRLGIGLYNILNLMNPEIVILGGIMLKYQDLYLEETRKIVNQNVWNKNHVQLIPSSLGDTGAALGAAEAVIQKWMEGKIPGAIQRLQSTWEA